MAGNHGSSSADWAATILLLLSLAGLLLIIYRQSVELDALTVRVAKLEDPDLFFASKVATSPETEVPASEEA
jgi:hypothetical protein